ncbi:MAG TPA: hypothetical protein PK095_11800, partial [Myxococcota bacterium]|nr:hypothetical protein [Myxococcota bacterium]
PDRNYLLNETMSFFVTFSEPVRVTYTPRLRVNIRTGGSTIRSARYAAGSGTNVLRFDYKIGTSDVDQDGIALSVTGTPTSPITLGTSTRIRDFGGNNAYLLYTTNDAYPGVFVDGIVPRVSSVARSPSTTVYLQTGANADFLVNYNEAVVVTGTPRLRIVVGTTTRHATYRPDLSTPTQLVFRHTILEGERDSNGISIYSPLELDGGQIRDLPGNPANLTLYSVASMSGLRVGCSDVAIKYRYGYSSLRTYTNTRPGGCSRLVFKLWGAGGGA